MSQHDRLIRLATVIFTGFLLFWAILWVKGMQGGTDTAELFSALYGSMALFGGIVGLKVSKHWGGIKSKVGRSVLFMSLGLLSQEAGQIVYSLYTYLLHQEVPYPSWGDAGYFTSVVLYTLATLSLISALSTKTTRRSGVSKIAVVIVPSIILSISYVIFLKGYHFDFSHPLTIFLDFGYPLGQAFYISLALLAYIISKRYLGGAMKPVILLFLFALALQYASDFTFLYQVSRDTWKTAGFNELMYLLSYYVMTLSLVRFGKVLEVLSKPRRSPA